MPNKKELAQQQQEARLAAFKKGTESHLEMATISSLPGILFSRKTVYYTKKEEKLDRAGAIHFIKKNGKTESFVWHATPHALKEATRYGLLPVESPTAKAIAALGQYRQRVLNRAYGRGIVSNKYKEKEELVNFAQNSMEALLNLERLVNTFNPSAGIENEKIRIKASIKKSIKELQQQKNSISDRIYLTKYDKEASKKISRFYEEKINILQALQEEVEKSKKPEKLKELLKPTGSSSIMTLVKTMSMATILKMQELNQNITYSRSAKSLLRGDLNNACEDALKELRDYEADPHNFILPEHQGLYPDNGDTIAVDFGHLGHDEKKIKSTLQAILAIDRTGIKLDFTSYDQRLRQTRFTKWQTNGSAGFTIKRMAAGIANLITGTVFGLAVDLPLGFLVSLLTLGKYKLPSLASQLTIKVDTGAPENKKIKDLYQHWSFTQYSAGAILGQKIGAFIGNTFFDVFTGLRMSVQNMKWKGLDEFVTDFQTGFWGGDHSKKSEDIISQAKNEFVRLREIRETFLYTIREKEQEVITEKPVNEASTITQSSRVLADVPYHLGSGEWQDIFNASCSGIKAVNDTFVHHIHAKHPFTGLIFTASYAAGGLAVLAPGLVSFLPHSYIAFSQTLGNMMAKGNISSAIASGFTQAKLFSATFEAVLHGGDSWLATGAKQFEKNPANTLVYGALAVGLGYTLANVLDVPFLSEYIKDDVGTAPYVGWAFAGGKIALLLVDLFEARESKADVENLTSSLDMMLKEQFPQAAPETIETYKKKLLHDKSIELNLRQQKEKGEQQLSQVPSMEVKRLQFMQMLTEHQDLLPELENKNKRDLLLLARHLFEGMENKEAFLKGLKDAFYPQSEKSIFSRTITIITNYIPLLVRCLLSPVSASLQPWRDLRDKLAKDVTRIPHGLGRLTTMFSRTLVRVGLRSPADVIANEILARGDGFIRNNQHSISSGTYAVSECYEKMAERLRQGASTPVDEMRKAATAPAVQTVFISTERQDVSGLVSKGFFAEKPSLKPSIAPDMNNPMELH
ncbi:hypothetical protein FOG18_05105 [Legionella israelensis]|uniref:hypothetical protein n=1 Tax=Legionella israelensis TaxID=454 RepID=UPI00117FB447|nr:hypothetical protein [Legionella israelensis]QDP71993.1 hypothetical protein FOG18_05105 [Legionella israelensis]